MDSALSSMASADTHACILAGGRSARMGRDKTGARLGNRTLLEIARARVTELKLPCAVIREDIVPKCGPLGGILTAFAQCDAERILLLPCDMPFVSAGLIAEVLRAAGGSEFGAGAFHDGLFCFPLCLGRAAEPLVLQQHAAARYSLQELARRLRLSPVTAADPARELFNINTEADLRKAERLLSA